MAFISGKYLKIIKTFFTVTYESIMNEEYNAHKARDKVQGAQSIYNRSIGA